MATLRRIEVVEPGGFLDKGIKRNEGDVYSEDPDQAQYYIDLGWAKCVETGEQGERVEGPNKIYPKSTIQVTKAK